MRRILLALALGASLGTAAEAKNSKSCSRKLFHVVRAIALVGGAEWVSDRRDLNPNAAGRT